MTEDWELVQGSVSTHVVKKGGGTVCGLLTPGMKYTRILSYATCVECLDVEMKRFKKERLTDPTGMAKSRYQWVRSIRRKLLGIKPY